MSEARTKQDQLLDIATYLKENEDNPSALLAPTLCKATHTRGEYIREAKQLIEQGIIQYGEDGIPCFTADYSKLQTALKTSQITTEKAEDAVLGVALKSIADETKAVAEQYYILGKAVWQGIAQWSSRKGISPVELAKMSLHEVVLDALGKRDEYDKLVSDLKRTRAELEVYRNETDPAMRLKETCRLIIEFTKAISLAELAGFNTERSGIVEYYQKAINDYMKGGKIYVG